MALLEYYRNNGSEFLRVGVRRRITEHVFDHQDVAQPLCGRL